MSARKAAEPAGKVFLTLAVALLASLVLWFISLPDREYDPVPSQTEYVTVSECVSYDGISQTMVSRGRMKGIRVQWATSKTVPVDDVIADLMDPVEGEFLERVIIPAADIRDNTKTDIVFTGDYGPGEYMVRLSCVSGTENKVMVWESATDSYKEGEAYNSRWEAEGRDWNFSLLTGYPDSLLVRHKVERIVYAALTVLASAAALCWIYGGGRLRKNRRIASAAGFARKHADGILLLLLVLIPTLVYLDWLTGERVYVFTMLDRGADSVGQTVPGLLNLADRVRRGLWGELFNFRQGLGNAEAAYFPTLTNWVALFGENAVARLLAFSQWAKVVLSGVFAYLFVKEYGAGAALRFLVALGYAFNSMLIARGAWESYPNISMLVMLWLWAYERKLNGKGVLLFFFSSLFMFINLGLYDCLFYALLFTGYLLVRRIIREDTFGAALKAFLKDLVPFAAFALLGMLDTVRYNLAKTLSSSRLQEGMSEYGETAGESIFTSAEIWMAAFLRTVGHSISGITFQTGSLNLLEGPAFYTGIAALLVTPAALWSMKGRQKGLYLALALAALVYIAVVPLRLLANGFSKETFKLSSFWITLILLLCAADFFRRAERKELRKGTGIVLGITAATAAALLVAAKACGFVAVESEWIVSLVFLALYPGLFLFLMTGRRARLVKALLILCAVAEAALVPWGMVHDRNTETAAENSRAEHAVTKEIAASLPADEWYRVEKDYVTVFETDSLAEGYRGSASYLGGIEINASVLDLYEAFSLPRRGNHYLFGTGGNIYFESASSTKYLLAKNGMAFRYGYELKEERNGIKVYENLYSHPFVYVSEELPSPESLRGTADDSGRIGYSMEDSVYVFGRLPENSVLVVEAESDLETRGTLYMGDRNGNFAYTYIMSSPHIVAEINNPEVYSLWFDPNTNRHLKNVTFRVTDRDTYYRAYREYAITARENGVPVEAEGENRFTGTVRAEEDGYIITAIPYDPKWEICLDEKIQDTIVVNGGFLGAKVPKGEHLLEIRYAGDSWIRGNLFKIIGLGSFLSGAAVVLFKRYRRS